MFDTDKDTGDIYMFTADCDSKKNAHLWDVKSQFVVEEEGDAEDGSRSPKGKGKGKGKKDDKGGECGQYNR